MMKKTSLLLTLLLLFSFAFAPAVFAAEDDPLASERALLNGVTLAPASTGIQPLDALVDEVIGSVTTEEMDTFERVMACYNYLLDNMSYASSMSYLHTPVGEITCGDIFYASGEVNGFGAVALSANKGLCNGYSAGFILLARRLGLPATLVEGSTLGGGGNYVYHKWTELVIDDVTYVFDPQLDQEVEGWGLPAYTCFAKTYEQMGRRFRK